FSVNSALKKPPAKRGVPQQRLRWARNGGSMGARGRSGGPRQSPWGRFWHRAPPFPGHGNTPCPRGYGPVRDRPPGEGWKTFEGICFRLPLMPDWGGDLVASAPWLLPPVVGDDRCGELSMKSQRLRLWVIRDRSLRDENRSMSAMPRKRR